MNLNEKINKNTILYYVEEYEEDYNDVDGTSKPKSYRLSFGFYNCQYFVVVTRENINSNKSSGCLLEGDEDLFDSFENAVENDLWETIKQKCNDYDKWDKEYEDKLKNKA